MRLSARIFLIGDIAHLRPRAVGLDVLVEPQAGRSLGQDGCERGLANLKRLAPQVVAAELDQVEGIEEDATIIAAVADAVEARLPSSSQHTASPSMIHERERSRASASTISGKR